MGGEKKLIRLFYFDPNMRVKRNVVVRLSVLNDNMRKEMKHSLSVCLA